MRNKGKEKIVAEEEQEAGSNYSSLLDDDYYFEDTYDETSNFMMGWRFQPTDQELVGFYLRRKTTNNLPCAHDFIPLVQLYVPGAEPWYVHPGSSRTAGSGSWVCNGKEVEIHGSRKQIIGYTNTFSFKMPDGRKRGVSTNWVMHEYRLYRDKIMKTRGCRRGGGGPVSDAQKELVLCRIRCTKAVGAPQE